MPGEGVNPSIAEMGTWCVTALGETTSPVATRRRRGQIELNVMMPVNRSQSVFTMRIITNASRGLRGAVRFEGIESRPRTVRALARAAAPRSSRPRPQDRYAEAAETRQKEAVCERTFTVRPV